MKNKPVILVFFVAIIIIAVLIFTLLHKTGIKIVLPEVPKKITKNIVLKNKIDKLIQEIKKDHKNGEKIGELGKLYHANMYYEEALDCYRLAQKIDDKNPYWNYFDAYIQQKMGNLGNNVTNLLQKTIKLEPDYSPAILKLGDIYFKLSQYERSEEEYAKLLDVDGISKYALLGLARIELRKKNWEKAKELLLKSTGIDPRFGIAYRLLAEIHKQFNDTRQMEMYRSRAGSYRFAEATDPWVDGLIHYCYDATELMRIADTLFKIRKIEQAIKIVERTARIFPDNTENYRIAGNDLLNLGEYEKAAEYFGKIIKINNKDIKAMVNKGAALLNLNRMDEAEKLINKAFELSPESSLAMYNAGYLSFKKGDINKAEKYFRKTLEIDPDYVRAYFNLGIIKKGQKQYREAIELFKNSLKIKKSIRKANLHIALIYLMGGNKKEGIKYLQNELLIDPDSETAYYFLANELAEAGKYEKAEQYYKNATNIYPDFIEARANLANLYEHMGKFTNAVKQYRYLLLIAPDDLKWRYLLGKSLIRSGNNSEGSTVLKTVLESARDNNNRYLVELIEKILKKER